MVMSDVYAGGDLAGHGMRRIAERADALLDCPSRDAVLVQAERPRFQPDITVDAGAAGTAFQSVLALRSAARRVGKEVASPCTSRWSPEHQKKTQQQYR